MKVALVLVFLVVLSVVFHLFSPWYLTPIASNWTAIDDTISLTFWVTGCVFIAVNLFLAYVIIRYRAGQGTKAAYEPENKRIEIVLTLLTTLGVAAMLAPGLVVWNEVISVPDDAHVVEAIGQQWQWTFRLPGEDGQLGTVDARLVTPANPFGINPADPNGQDDILVDSNELHLPIDRPVKVLLRSKDVLHNFAVPQFRVKMDLVPGSTTYLWFTPTREGSFEILCEELCGLAHFTMRGRVLVDSEADYQQWLSQLPTFSESQEFVAGKPEQGQVAFALCAGCHGQQGEGNQSLNAPKLAGMGHWYITRQLTYYQQGIRGQHEKDIYGQQMAPMAALLAQPNAIADVAAYIQSLDSSPVVGTLEGDPARGHGFYYTCGTCHGTTGQGNRGLNAPRLAGQHDWYIKRQLENFKHGIRGQHKQDLYGVQMRLMSKILPDEQALNDIAAYINTL